MKYLQESGLRVPLSSQVSPPSQSPLEARGEALLRPGGGRGGPGLGGHGGVQAEDGGVRGAGGRGQESLSSYLLVLFTKKAPGHLVAPVLQSEALYRNIFSQLVRSAAQDGKRTEKQNDEVTSSQSDGYSL